MIKSKILQQIKPVKCFAPASNDGTAITGTAIDRLGAQSMVLAFQAAAPTGTPTAATTAITITDCDTSSGTYAAFLTVASALDISAAVDEAYHISLQGAKRYIKVNVDSTYTGGTTPANVLAASAILGDYDVEPPATETVLGV